MDSSTRGVRGFRFKESRGGSQPRAFLSEIHILVYHQAMHPLRLAPAGLRFVKDVPPEPPNASGRAKRPSRCKHDEESRALCK